jgi:transketolase
MRAIANMTVIVPSDIYEARDAIFASIAKPGPVYIRLRRGPDPIVYTEELDYKIGQANVLRQGSDVTLIACGRSVAESIVAAELLSAEGISSCVLDMHTIKPIDVSAIEEAAARTRMIFTIEQHNIIGGLGGAVAEVMANLGSSTPLRRLGLPDIYGGIGPREQLIDKHGLTGPKIADEVLSAIG